MIQLNLLPDVKKEYIKAQRVKHSIISTAFVIGGASIGLVVLLFMTVYMFQSQKLNSLNKEIASNINTLTSVEDLDKVLTIQNQINALPGLHEDKPKVKRLFEYVSTITPPNVSLSELEMDFDGSSDNRDKDDKDDENDNSSRSSNKTGTLTITGEAQDFKAVNIFVDTLKNTKYQASNPGSEDTAEDYAFPVVVLDSLANKESAEKYTAAFTVIISFDYTIFDYGWEKVMIGVPEIESSVSSLEQPFNKQNTDPFGANDPESSQDPFMNAEGQQ